IWERKRKEKRKGRRNLLYIVTTPLKLLMNILSNVHILQKMKLKIVLIHESEPFLNKISGFNSHLL
ncbi:MAG: hypothetical protein P8X73_17865, partial [Ignavibacteriaceae bacterium]